jgi:pyrimidine operon attenuation protein / uracil phosphoribosyltransferase
VNCLLFKIGINSLNKFLGLKTILDKQQLHLTLLRLSHQLLENHADLNNVVFIGLQPRGVKVSEKIVQHIKQLSPGQNVDYGLLDITFYRDDIRKELHEATIRAALDALQDFGRPQKVELCVLVDRRFNRELPIHPDYCGKAIDTITSQKVKVEWEREEVVLY